MRGLLRLPLRVQVWVAILMALNGIAPLFFLPHVEAQAVLGTLMVSAMLMGAITGSVGFTRLLGLGHFFWFALLPYLWGRLDAFEAGSPEGIWLRTVIAVNSISLFLDVVDVVRYTRGERAEIVSGLDT